MFPGVKKVFNLTRPTWNARGNGYIFLEALQYFLHHGEVVLYDPEPLFRQYFDAYLTANCPPSPFCSPPFLADCFVLFG